MAYRGLMTRTNGDDRRRRRNIRERGGSRQVRVYAGIDPVTNKPRHLAGTIKGTDRPAHRRAEKAMTRLQAQVDKQRSPETSTSLGEALDEWLRVNEIEDTTRHTYVGYIERTIKLAIGTVAIDKLSARTLETLYRELRRCRMRCAQEILKARGLSN
jgi:integrase